MSSVSLTASWFAATSLVVMSSLLTLPVLAADAGGITNDCVRPLPASPPPVLSDLQFETGPGFLYVPNALGAANVACASELAGNTALLALATQATVQTGFDPQLVVVLTTTPLLCGDLFYIPVANDARGIGYQHLGGRETFDDSPDTRLEGIAFLNDFPYWQQQPQEFETAFLHEVGHRWGARVRFADENGPTTSLLGRQLLHWSYFLDTQGSPLEGNRFTTTDDGRTRIEAPPTGSRFSALDLYLMGVLPAGEVPPLDLYSIQGYSIQGDPLDCSRQTLEAQSPPQRCNPITVDTEFRSIPIDAVIAAEGERDPAITENPEVEVLVLVLGDDADLDAQMCRDLQPALQARIDDFERATSGRLKLHNLVSNDGPCPTPPPAQAQNSDGTGCTVTNGTIAAPQRPTRRLVPLGALASLWLALFSRKRPNSPSPKAL